MMTTTKINARDVLDRDDSIYYQAAAVLTWLHKLEAMDAALPTDSRRVHLGLALAAARDALEHVESIRGLIED